jgi:hypothetical protein
MSLKVLFAVCLIFGQVVSAQQTLDNESLTNMVRAGLSDDIIITTIRTQAGQFNTTADGLIALKSAGVDDKVIAAMLIAAAGPTPRTKPSASSETTPPEKEATDSPEADPKPSPAPDPQQPSAASVPGRIEAGARIVIAPMGGFETYFAAAVREKKVPIALTVDRSSAQYFIVSTNTEWQGFVYGAAGSANWNRGGGSASYGASASSTRGLEASIMLIDAKTKDIVWAYEVHKNSHGSLLFGTLAARGQQSLAEACA